MTCPNCNGDLMVSARLERAICNYCGHSFLVVKDAIPTQASAETLVALGDVAREAGNRKEAYEYYSRALELNPEEYRAWFEKAVLTPSHSRYLDVLLPTDPDFGNLGMIDEVRTYLEKALRYAPEDVRAPMEAVSVQVLATVLGMCAEIARTQYGGCPDQSDKELNVPFIGFVASMIDRFDTLLADVTEKQQIDLALVRMGQLCEYACDRVTDADDAEKWEVYPISELGTSRVDSTEIERWKKERDERWEDHARHAYWNGVMETLNDARQRYESMRDG